MSLRRPEAWPEAQRELREQYLADPAGIPRRPVHVTWSSTAPGRYTVHQDGFDFTLEVAAIDDPSQVMRFAATRDLRPPTSRGRTDGLLLGEFGANAATGVEMAGGVVWPEGHPQVSVPSPSVQKLKVVRDRWMPADGLPPEPPGQLTPGRAVSVGLAVAALLLISIGARTRIGDGSGILAGWWPFVVAGVLMVAAWLVLGSDSRRRPGPFDRPAPDDDRDLE